MTYPNQNNIMKKLSKLADKAFENDLPQQGLVYEAAAELTDDLLKGDPDDGPENLAKAFQRNIANSFDNFEIKAWEKALQILDEEMSRV